MSRIKSEMIKRNPTNTSNMTTQDQSLEYKRHKSILYQPKSIIDKRRLSFSQKKEDRKKETLNLTISQLNGNTALETQQTKSLIPSSKPKIVLYRSQARSSSEKDYKCDSYPPPKPLRPALADNIKKILTQSQEIEIKLTQPKRNKFNYKGFINPKIFEMFKSRQSQIKKTIQKGRQIGLLFSFFMSQTIADNPTAASSILYTGLSASAMASFHFHSVQTRRRIQEASAACPETDSYPLTKSAHREIDEIQTKIQKERERKQQHQNKSEMDQMKELLTCDIYNEKYFKNLKNVETDYTELYGTIMKDYKEVMEYCNALREENNTIDIEKAQKDINYIKKSKDRYENQTKCIQNSDLKFSHRRIGKIIQKYDNKNKQQLNYDDEVFSVRPNSLQHSSILVNRQRKKRANSEHFNN